MSFASSISVSVRHGTRKLVLQSMVVLLCPSPSAREAPCRANRDAMHRMMAGSTMPSPASSLAPMASVAEICPSPFAVIVMPDKVDAAPSRTGRVVSMAIAASFVSVDEFRTCHNLTQQGRSAPSGSHSSFEAQEHRCAFVGVIRLPLGMKGGKRQNLVIAPKAPDAKTIALSDERRPAENDLRAR